MADHTSCHLNISIQAYEAHGLNPYKQQLHLLKDSRGCPDREWTEMSFISHGFVKTKPFNPLFLRTV